MSFDVFFLVIVDFIFVVSLDLGDVLFLLLVFDVFCDNFVFIISEI